jgi:spore germination protein (amino acid permease)
MQLFMMLILAIGLVQHVTIIPLLLQASQKDAWVGVLLTLPLMLVWALLPWYIVKHTGHTALMEWIGDHVGSVAAKCMASVVSLFLLCSAFITLKETITWIQVTFLPQTPLLVTSIVLLALCFYAATKGIKSLVITSGILLPFVLLLGYFVMGANFEFKRYTLIFPLFENGLLPALKTSVYMGGSVMELLVFLLMQHHVKKRVKRSHLLITVALFVCLTLGPLMGSLAAFGMEAPLLRYPSYEQWRLVTVGKYISHVDFLSIYQWLAGAFIRISLTIVLLPEVWQIKARPVKNGLMLGMVGVLLAFMAAPLSDISFLAYLSVYYKLSFWLLLLFSLILFMLVYIQVRRGAKKR